MEFSDFVLPFNNNPQNGISFDDGGHRRQMFGGSFFHAPNSDEFIKINLMAEYNLPSDIHVPIRDFSVPQHVSELTKVFDLIRESEKPVYVGCFGGKGRTGLFMACFLKYLGDHDAVATVRRQYRPEAVETQEQEFFVRQFPVASDVLASPSALAVAPTEHHVSGPKKTL